MFTQCPQKAPTVGVSEKAPQKPKHWREACAESAARAGVKSTPTITATSKNGTGATLTIDQDQVRAMVGKTGRGRHEAGRMNKLETRYSEHLELRRQVGEIRRWAFEAMKLILAPRTSYTVDFFVVLANGTIELHETKGHWEDDARVKAKVAPVLFPEFQFVGVKWDKQAGDWKFEIFPRGGNR